MTANLRVTLIQADLAWQDPATNRRNLAAHFRGLAGHRLTHKAAHLREDWRGTPT